MSCLEVLTERVSLRGQGFGKVTGRIWPNGECTYGFCSTKILKEIGASKVDIDELLDRIPMGSSDLANSHSLEERPKRGHSGLTSYGGRLVRNSVWLMERRYGTQNLAFGTCTVPPMDRERSEKCCEDWSEIVRRFVIRLTRLQARRNMRQAYCHVTEIQEKRLSDSDPGLHLHIVFPGRTHLDCGVMVGTGWGISKSEFAEIWKLSLEDILGESITDCWSACTRVEAVKKTAGGYLSKYMSKGSALQRFKELGWQHPSSWFGVSAMLKSAVTDSCCEGQDIGEWLLSADKNRPEFVIAFHGIRLNRETFTLFGTERSNTIVGGVGVLDAKLLPMHCHFYLLKKIELEARELSPLFLSTNARLSLPDFRAPVLKTDKK